jgi:simple sugar transport system ATP-binding protein
VCSVQGLTVKNSEQQVKLNQVSLEVHAGEIVGVAGVEGNGQFELVNAIMGLIPIEEGHIFVQGKELTRAPIIERRKLISYVPQDRSKMGASLSASIMENAIMTHHLLNPHLSQWKGLLLNYAAARRFTDELEKRFSVTMASKYNPIRSLSGGNQQKVILGRELLLNCPFVLLDQPTRGLDVVRLNMSTSKCCALAQKTALYCCFQQI